MIKVEITRTDVIEHVRISGHANYSEHGTDIVCSAVSSMSILTVNALYKFGLGPSCEIEADDDGLIDIRVKDKNDVIIQTLLTNLIDNLEELESQFQEYIMIEK